MAAVVHQFTCLSDNFGLLIHDPVTMATASIDAPEAAPILKALDEKGWVLSDILVTHHHPDHVQGIGALKARFPNARVIGPRGEAAKIPVLELLVGEGDNVIVGSLRAKVLETPGHTLGHIIYHFAGESLLFAGDTLFSLGCGRAFEAPPAVLYASVEKIRALPPETQLYCGHEYTLSNGAFALRVDPDNADLQARVAEVQALRAENKASLPVPLSRELLTNPFLRADDGKIAINIGLAGASPADVFTELRNLKNKG